MQQSADTHDGSKKAEHFDRCIANRYVLRQAIGRGGHGEVWEAEDTLTQSFVAVKLLKHDGGLEPARVRREVSALRLLRIPGVVQMLDEGVDQGQPFLVMERISGAPFPGHDKKNWQNIAATTIALFETLARVHSAGVVHRDVKPGNVLVDEMGRPTLLDFGLSLGPSLAQGLTSDGHILGTPDYLAPEQIVGETITPATDLYAVGVMLYEALSGRLPHETDDFQTLMRMRLTESPARLWDIAPDVPPSVADTIDSLLLRAANERPRSADEVLDRLQDQRSRSSMARGKYLGERLAMDKLLLVIHKRQSVDLAGVRGAGRTRCLQEIAAVLAETGREVVWTTPGKRPFSSLVQIVTPNNGTGRTLADVMTDIDRQLEEILAADRVILADDPSRMDRYSLAALEKARVYGPIVRVVDISSEENFVESENLVLLRSWPEAQLRELFVGPDRVFHLCEDAARELYARSEGLPLRIFGELATWERTGLAQTAGSSWIVGREALDRLAAGRVALPLPPPAVATDTPLAIVPAHLEDLATSIELAWPHTRINELAQITEQPSWRIEADLDELEQIGALDRLVDGRLIPRIRKSASSRRNTERRKNVHRAIAKFLPRGTEGRLFHLIAARSEREVGNPLEIVEETLTLTERLAMDGFLGRATALLADGIMAARNASMPDTDWGETRLLGLWVEVAISDGSPRALDRALYEVCRATTKTEDVQALERLVRAALAMRTTAGDRALSLVDSIAPFTNPDLERRRQHVRVQSARLCSAEQERVVITDAERWALGIGGAAEAGYADWLGRFRYREGRFDDAAALHLKAAAGQSWTTERIGALLNGASALLEAFQFNEAVAVAEDAQRSSAECRHAYCEARAEWLKRSAQYRRGDHLVEDEDLVTLAAKTGVIDLEALVSLNEAAIAWRNGNNPLAAALAGRTKRLWTAIGKSWGALFAQALSAMTSGTTITEWNVLVDAAKRCPVPGAGIQMLGMLGVARPDAAIDLAPVVLSLRTAIPEQFWGLRMDVLSVDETCRYVEERST